MDQPKHDKKRRGIAALLTAAFHAAMLAVLLLSCLHYTQIDLPDDRLEQDITFFGGEYVMLGNQMANANDDPASALEEPVNVNTGDDIEDQGTSGESEAPLVTSEVESPMKVEEKPKPDPGPTKEELAEQQRIKEQEEASRRVNQSVTGAFTQGSGRGNGGRPDGNAPSGDGTRPGISGAGLTGYTLEHWGRPSSTVVGTVVVRVRVNSQGRVVEAKYDHGSGTAASDPEVRRSCEQASLQSQFKVPKGTVNEAIGYITWRFQ